ncbi:MAG: hypothetical protein Q8N53_17610 [Longimicrobiales bacterium]|nr:hypothetical protein [Longimicrobiales bacterium]
MTPARRRALLTGLITLATAAACDALPDHVQEQARRRRLAALGVERFDSAAAFRLAGMSTHREIKIDALDPGELGADTLVPAYHVFRMRCGSCHAVPSPGSKPAFLWDAAMSRMKKNAADAGLMPISPDDEAKVLQFLREHAADRP